MVGLLGHECFVRRTVYLVSSPTVFADIVELERQLGVIARLQVRTETDRTRIDLP